MHKPFAVELHNLSGWPTISEISVTETITEMEIIDPTLTEIEMMVFVETEII